MAEIEGVQDLLLEYKASEVLRAMVEDLRLSSIRERKHGDIVMEDSLIAQAGIIERIIPQVKYNE